MPLGSGEAEGARSARAPTSQPPVAHRISPAYRSKGVSQSTMDMLRTLVPGIGLLYDMVHVGAPTGNSILHVVHDQVYTGYP